MQKLSAAVVVLAIVTLFCPGLRALELQARTGPIYVLEITAPDSAALHALVDEGYDVATVHGLKAKVYATDAERGQLIQKGWPVSEIVPEVEGEKALGTYHTYASMTQDLQAYVAAHPAFCRLVSLGQSYQGRELWAMLITDNPDAEEDEPECKFVSTIHGNEVVGTELCLYLIDHLLSQYGQNERVTDLVDGTELWIVPLMNPDGYVLNRRYNAQGYDLNRSFPNYPDDFTATTFTALPDISQSPPEVAVIVNWTLQHSFTLGANFHTGALVVNYPYDYDQLPSGTSAPSPDEALFQWISRRYSFFNVPMWNSPEFDDGVVNGSDWYSLTGGMQDWDYRFAACNAVTIELSNIDKPAASTLPQLWLNNRDSMLSYLETAHIGVRGIITDADTGAPVYAQVHVQGNTQPVFTDPEVGDYHRMLLPGVYTLTASAPGYFSQTVPDVIVTDGAAIRVDMSLQHEPVPPMPVLPLSKLLLFLLLAFLGLGWIF